MDIDNEPPQWVFNGEMVLQKSDGSIIGTHQEISRDVFLELRRRTKKDRKMLEKKIKKKKEKMKRLQAEINDLEQQNRELKGL